VASDGGDDDDDDDVSDGSKQLRSTKSVELMVFLALLQRVALMFPPLLEFSFNLSLSTQTLLVKWERRVSSCLEKHNKVIIDLLPFKCLF
jgi:hypothetical protein